MARVAYLVGRIWQLAHVWVRYPLDPGHWSILETTPCRIELRCCCGKWFYKWWAGRE